MLSSVFSTFTKTLSFAILAFPATSIAYIISQYKMSSNSQNSLLLFLYPYVYQTVSFHHQASYSIKISSAPLSFRVHSLHTTRQEFTEDVRIRVDRGGNVMNVGGSVQGGIAFETDRFQIEYNDQLIKFKTGCIAKLTPNIPTSIAVSIELLKHQSAANDSKKRETPKRVSGEVLELNLISQDDGPRLRRVVFPINEYISYVDVAYQFAWLGKSTQRKQNPKESLRQSYQSYVLARLKFYRQLRVKVQAKVEEFQETKFSHFSFIQIYKISTEFQANFVDQWIEDLDYVAVEHKIQENNVESNIELHRQESLERSQQNQGFQDLLCAHYQCLPAELVHFVRAEGYLIERNIRALFERLVQLTISLLGEYSFLVCDQEIARVGRMIAEGEKHLPPSSKQITCRLDKQGYLKYKHSMNSYLRQLGNVTGSELRQPVVQVINAMERQRAGKLAVQSTLTVFIHGYKGNQYDLSKIKSHLNMLFGFSNFYSVKGIGVDKNSDCCIRKLGEMAANEITSFLALNPYLHHINVIGFSLGGLIARAMLPWLEAHKDKLNLLVTVASPHLGIREIQSCLVRAGLCYMRRIAGIESIRQLNSQRNGGSRYLLELAAGIHLQWFKSIILVGSCDDMYVPAYSSLATYEGEDPITLQISTRLSQKMGRAVRCVVKLQYNQSLLDLITLRRTHISFLQQDCFIRHLIVRFQDYFLYSV